jgi:hypothetical protein
MEHYLSTVGVCDLNSQLLFRVIFHPLKMLPSVTLIERSFALFVPELSIMPAAK